MGVEKDQESYWLKLNDNEQTANTNSRSRPGRDWESRPWTVEDHEDIRCMIQDMYGRLDRMEQRQQVLFRITHATLLSLNGLRYTLVFAAIAALLIAVFHKLV